MIVKSNAESDRQTLTLVLLYIEPCTISGENYYEVKSGLGKGEMIVIGGYRALSKELNHGDLVMLKN